MLGRNQFTGERPTSLSGDGFAEFFSKKVSAIRAATDGSPPPDIRTSATTSMSIVQPVTEAEVRRVIMKAPSKSSSLDPIPTYLLKEVIDVLLPYITALVNASLQQGCHLSPDVAETRDRDAAVKEARCGHGWHGQLQARVQPVLSFEDGRACCRRAAQQISDG